MKKDNIIIKKESIREEVDVYCQKEVIKVLTDALMEKGLVKETFYDELLKREENFPTGLETASMGIAIPHTDPQNVIEDSLAVAILDEPINFYGMEDFNKEVEVKIIFMLAFTDSADHLETIKRIVKIIKDKDFLNNMLSMDKDKLSSLINKKLIL